MLAWVKFTDQSKSLGKNDLKMVASCFQSFVNETL